MIDYEVEDLIKILIKKWYIILLTAIVFSAVSIPLAQISYRQALSNYNKYVSEKDEERESEKEYIHCSLTVRATEISDMDNREAAQSVYQLLNIPLIKDIINNGVVWDETTAIEDINTQISISLTTSDNVILLGSDTMSKDNFTNIVVGIKSIFEKDLRDLIDQQIDVQFGDIISEVIPQIEVEESFAEAVMRKPDMINSYKRILLTACILGILIGTLVVLVKEYVTANKARMIDA